MAGDADRSDQRAESILGRALQAVYVQTK